MVALSPARTRRTPFAKPANPRGFPTTRIFEITGGRTHADRSAAGVCDAVARRIGYAGREMPVTLSARLFAGLVDSMRSSISLIAMDTCASVHGPFNENHLGTQWMAPSKTKT